jgi:pimeloyl-ACP methyl ester carboxylesterase
VVAYGGAFHNGLTYGALARQSALSGYAGWRDLAAAAEADSYTAPLNPELAAVTFQGPGVRYEVPVFLASGAYDHRTDPGLAAQFVADIAAPAKAFVSFPNSAHSPPFEEPEAFRAWLVKTVRPLAPPASPPRSAP